MNHHDEARDRDFEEQLRAVRPAASQIDLSILDHLLSPEPHSRLPLENAQPAKRERTWQVAALSYCVGLAMGVVAMACLPRLLSTEGSVPEVADLPIEQPNQIPKVALNETDANANPEVDSLRERSLPPPANSDAAGTFRGIDLRQFDIAEQGSLTPRGFLASDQVAKLPMIRDDASADAGANSAGFEPPTSRYQLRQLQEDLSDPSNWVL